METIDPVKSLINSAKETSEKLSKRLDRIKSINVCDPQFEEALQDLKEVHKQADIMLKRLEVSRRYHSENP